MSQAKPTSFLHEYETALAQGAIRADDLTVLGVISGDILARQVRLAPSAVVHADVTHDRIVIEPGAELEGRLARKV